MSWKVIETYELGVRVATGSGLVIHMKDTDGKIHTFSPASVLELAAYADILRNEKPVRYETETGSLQVGQEPVGEEEGGG